MQNSVLRQGEVRSLAVRNGETIRATSGVLWLTLDGQSEDYFLQAGQTWEAPQKGRAVVQAMQAGEIEFFQPRRLGAVARLKSVWPWHQTIQLNGPPSGSAKRPQPHCPA